MLRTTAVTKGSLGPTASFLPVYPEGPLSHADPLPADAAAEGVPKVPPWFDVTNFTRTQLGGIAAMPTITVAQAYPQGITGVSINSGSASSGIASGSMYQHVAGNQTADELTLRRAVGALQSNIAYQVEWALKLLLVKSYGEDVYFSETPGLLYELTQKCDPPPPPPSSSSSSVDTASTIPAAPSVAADISAEEKRNRHKMVLAILFNLFIGNKDNLNEGPRERYFIDYLCGHFKNDLCSGDFECFRMDIDILNVISYFIPFEIKDSFTVPTLIGIFTNYGTDSTSSRLVNDGPIMSSATQTLAALAAAGYNDKWFVDAPRLYEKIASLIVLNNAEKANKAPLLRLCCHVCRVSQDACSVMAASQLVPRALVLAFREFVEMVSTQEDLSANIRDHGRTIASAVCFIAAHCPGSFAVFEHFFAYVAASETVNLSVSAYAGFICASIFKAKQQ